MKKIFLFVLAFVLVLSVFFGCASTTAEDIANQDQAQAEASGLTIHKIGVATYNVADPQVRMFKSYLDDYIKECFPNVTFLYSKSLTGSEDMMAFLETCGENGAEGIMLLTSYDLPKEVELCAEKGMYVIRPAATSSDADFEAVASNPFFVGEIGPGADNEYNDAAAMTRALAAEGKQYLILSGGAAIGNEMHRLRTIAMLDVLQEIYGVRFEKTSEELALVEQPTAMQVGFLKIILCPGYVSNEANRSAMEEAIRSGGYTTVLSTIPVTQFMDLLESMEMEAGVMDFFSEENYFGFKDGTIAYVAGKYQSEIGPGFAALFNAVLGDGDVYRVDGKAFRLEQGFWSAANETEYDSKYALACSATINAYNYEDLYSVIKSMNPETSFEAFRELTESYSYEDCLARRSGN